jgi:hypothetical protein
MKTDMRVHDDEGDRCSRASTVCISPTVASVVARRPGGGGGQCCSLLAEEPLDEDWPGNMRWRGR